MSVFKKMKDKITDEMNSASNKLQNIQIIDQLTTSLGPQVFNTDTIPHQALPYIGNQQDISPIEMPKIQQFSLANVDICEDDEELNSEISSHHQLFNDSSIRRINQSITLSDSSTDRYNGNVQNGNDTIMAQAHNTKAVDVEQSTVIEANDLSSDIEIDFEDSNLKDEEVDLLQEKEVPTNSLHDDKLAVYRKRFRCVVHLTRKLNSDLELERKQHELQVNELQKKITSMNLEIEMIKRSSSDSIASMNVHSDGESVRHGSNRKLRDLEKLMAKCKESLKTKNAQIKILNAALLEVETFREYIDDVKAELRELRHVHETFTLSIAENKRIMHQEIESKNLEIDKLKTEIKDLQNQLKESNTKSLQLRSNIQNLESRIVSTSAAHQKERESLIKELVANKNTAIKLLQRDHDLQLERVKLDLEKKIESLKSDILMKDEQIIRDTERQRELQLHNCALKTDLESTKTKFADVSQELSQLKKQIDTKAEQSVSHSTETPLVSDVCQEFNDCQTEQSQKCKNDELKAKNGELVRKLEDISIQLDSLKETNGKLQAKLYEKDESLDNKQVIICERCQRLESQMLEDSDRYEQALFESKTKLDLMTTANSDQERILNDLKCEREKATESFLVLKAEFDEMMKKNETLSQVIQDNETELQNQQEHQAEMASIKQQLDNNRRETNSLRSELTNANNELSERSNELARAQETIDELRCKLNQVEQETLLMRRSLEAIRSEKDALALQISNDSKRHHEMNQQLVINIVAAMKNLETPDVSPGSDKNFKVDLTEISNSHSTGVNLPNPVRLAEELSSIALDRCNAYVTSNQRLQALQLDNTMLNDEVRRLKEELNALTRERTNEAINSFEELERLRSENQALIHDQVAYDDQIQSLEGQIESLRSQILEVPRPPSATDVSNVTIDLENSEMNLKEQLALRERELEIRDGELNELRRILRDKEKLLDSRKIPEPFVDVPDATEFKYLKNIVYQFMMGKEPTTLARVISAVFKFESEQVEQICRVQEAIHQISG